MKKSKKYGKKDQSPAISDNATVFPMRINKYLAMKNYSTRRGADSMIEKKLVSINGRVAKLGDKVNETDTVQVRSNKKPEAYVYYAYNKPRGISTDDNRKGTKSISQSIPLRGVFPVGSLDTNAQGLIILTNDRRIIDRLQNPKHNHVKEYSLKVLAPINPKFKERMAAGVLLGNGEKVSADVNITSELTCVVRISTHNNPVREMCSLLGVELESLTRIRILNIGLNKLAENDYRKIDGEELAIFLKSLGL